MRVLSSHTTRLMLSKLLPNEILGGESINVKGICAIYSAEYGRQSLFVFSNPAADVVHNGACVVFGAPAGF